MNKLYCIIWLTLILSSCGSRIMDGYTDKVSYSLSDSISIFINAEHDLKDYQIDITDINGNVLQSTSASVFPQTMQDDKPYQNGYGYQATTKISVPCLGSGVYLLGEKIPFIIKPENQFDILILYSSNTENAYCHSGGKSTYAYNSSNDKAATVVSFKRPIGLPTHSAEFLKWIATQNYNVGYICDQDLEDYQNIASAKLLIIPGHSEYWTRRARENFDRFINEGKDPLILSGNTMWWQVRYDSTESKMICCKYGSVDSNTTPLLRTICWTDPALEYDVIGSIGLDFDQGGYGKKQDNGWDGYKIVNSASPLLRGTGLNSGEVISLPTDEYDGAKLSFSSDSIQVALKNASGFYQYELIGYDLASRQAASNGAWIVMQKTKTSGVIINTGSTNWCKKEGMEGESSELIKKITLNMIDLLLKKERLFTTKK